MNREKAREWTAGKYRSCLSGQADAYQTFLNLIDGSFPPGGRAADLGCGEEGYLSFLLERAEEVVGVDGRPLRGPYTRYVRADLERELPLEEGSLDLAAGKFLLEHLKDPAGFMCRVHGALRAGGVLVLMTPDVRYYPYAVNYLLSRALPQRARMRLVGAFTGRGEGEIFPVFYRCNTPEKLRENLVAAGFEVELMGTYSDYQVSAVCRPLGALAVLYEAAQARLGMDGPKGFIVAAASRK